MKVNTEIQQIHVNQVSFRCSTPSTAAAIAAVKVVQPLTKNSRTRHSLRDSRSLTVFPIIRFRSSSSSIQPRVRLNKLYNISWLTDWPTPFWRGSSFTLTIAQANLDSHTAVLLTTTPVTPVHRRSEKTSGRRVVHSMANLCLMSFHVAGTFFAL